MKIIQKSGIALFVFSLIVLSSTLLLSKFDVTPEIIIERAGDTEKGRLLSKQEKLTVEFSNSWDLTKQMNESFKVVNEALVEKYKISPAKAGDIVGLLKENKYDTSAVNSAFYGNPDQARLVIYNTTWMLSKEYSSRDEILNDLSTKINELNADLGNIVGFTSYEISDLKFAFARASNSGYFHENRMLFFFLSFVLGIIGALLFILPRKFLEGAPGIKHNNIFKMNVMNQGWIGILLGSYFILFYILLYWYPWHLTSWVILVDPISKMMSGHEASQWFMYGFLYTLAITVMGVRMYIKYWNNAYQIVRTTSVIIFQIATAFIIPQILSFNGLPEKDLKNIFPLDYSFLFQYNIGEMVEGGTFGFFLLIWGMILFLIGVPVLTYFFGKRWYCSWVCGCGGLAETLGDPFRQLSDKSLKGWRIERYMVHSVLVFIIGLSILNVISFVTGAGSVMGIDTYSLQTTYKFAIASIFAGVVGTGFYPFMGDRVWCRFGCPLAAYLGLVQRFKSRFRITTNGGQCISCGNCSTYCEMGIDVRHYAQRGQNIVRSSCVGCGVCASVCPRGVLKLENAPENGRIEDNPIIIGNDSIKLNENLTKGL